MNEYRFILITRSDVLINDTDWSFVDWYLAFDKDVDQKLEF